MSELPTGTVTFVFTDIEASTALLDRLGDGYGEVLFAHQALLRGVWDAHGGVEVGTEGDAFFVAFSSASGAVAATAAGQAVLAAHAWPHGEPVRVRMGVHTGEPRIREGEYWGPDVHYAARVASAASGGQVLVSAVTAALARRAELTSLGRHRLKDFPQPRELFAVGPGPHPAPKTLDPLRTNLPSAPTPLVGRDDEVDEVVSLLLGDARLVTVVGAGGAGKTRLALAVADRLLDELADGAFLVELAEVTTSDAVAGAIAAVVGTTADLLAGTLDRCRRASGSQGWEQASADSSLGLRAFPRARPDPPRSATRGRPISCADLLGWRVAACATRATRARLASAAAITHGGGLGGRSTDEAHTASPARQAARQDTVATVDAAKANSLDGGHRAPARRGRRTAPHRLRCRPANRSGAR